MNEEPEKESFFDRRISKMVLQGFSDVKNIKINLIRSQFSNFEISVEPVLKSLILSITSNVLYFILTFLPRFDRF